VYGIATTYKGFRGSAACLVLICCQFRLSPSPIISISGSPFQGHSLVSREHSTLYILLGRSRVSGALSRRVFSPFSHIFFHPQLVSRNDCNLSFQESTLEFSLDAVIGLRYVLTTPFFRLFHGFLSSVWFQETLIHLYTHLRSHYWL
jgi:hypothetical protein